MRYPGTSTGWCSLVGASRMSSAGAFRPHADDSLSVAGAAVQTAIVPAGARAAALRDLADAVAAGVLDVGLDAGRERPEGLPLHGAVQIVEIRRVRLAEIGRASCRERV